MNQEKKVVNKKKLISIAVVPLLAIALLLQVGVGAASFLIGIGLTFATEAAWKRFEKKEVGVQQ